MAARILFFLLLCAVSVNCDILCEEGFCSSFLLENTCSTPAEDCSFNNETHSGLWLPSPTLCNCCPYCLPMYGLGRPCSLGGSGTGTTVGRCGEGLYCDNSTRTCARMQTKCHDAQDEYDARHVGGETGALEKRPSCDNKGNFASFECVPSQTCFCQSEEGERLFGEVLYSGEFMNMPCECSRMAAKIDKIIAPDVPFPIFGLRCTSDGNFNPIQCLENTCYCVNPITGVKVGTERINLEEHPISKLPCYDPNLDLFPIKDDAKPPYEYTTPCFEGVQEREDLIQKSIDEGYNVDFFSTFGSISCLPDGTFGRMTINSNGSKICVNERGVQISNYEAQSNTPEFDNMDCKCALTSTVMSSSNEPPQCCKNGNFRQIQCRRGQCRCVDSDGRQIGKENNDIIRLPCYNINWRDC